MTRQPVNLLNEILTKQEITSTPMRERFWFNILNVVSVSKPKKKKKRRKKNLGELDK